MPPKAHLQRAWLGISRYGGIVLAGLLLWGCSPFVLRPPLPPLAPQRVATLLTLMEDQGRRGRTFFSRGGRLVIEREDEESTSWDLLMVGRRDPLRIKMEITHPWGKPIVHLLVRDHRVRIISFPERRIYEGDVEDLVSSALLPVGPALDQLWSLGRGYPKLRDYDQAASLAGDQITLFRGEKERIQVIDFEPGTDLPKEVLYPKEGVRVRFDEYITIQEMTYARDMRLQESKTKSSLALSFKEIVFDQEIPEAIFELNGPSNFERHPLRRKDADLRSDCHKG